MNINKTHGRLHFLPPTFCLTLSYIYYLQTIFQKMVQTLETGSHYHWRDRYPGIEFAHSYTLTNYNHVAYIDGWVMVYPKKKISSLYKFIHSNCHIVSMYLKTGRKKPWGWFFFKQVRSCHIYDLKYKNKISSI